MTIDALLSGCSASSSTHRQQCLAMLRLAFVEAPPDVPRLWVALCCLIMFLH